MVGRTPIIEALQKHKSDNPISFHVPGHKNGRIWPEELRAFEQMLQFDKTELEGLDDLHDASEAIAESQALCAAFYGAAETSYLVGGSTSGNLAMVYGLFQEGDIVLVQRNCHKSVLHALELARAKAVFLAPEYDRHTNHPVGLSGKTVETAIHRYPNAKGIFLTYPDYWGVSLNQTSVFQIAKKAGLLVLVDEAHGAHFKLGEHDHACPPTALELGAGVVVQSAHKMLPALTMGAWLHFSTSLDIRSRQRIKRALSMLQSSSPSYLLLASLDAARAFLEGEGKRAFQEALRSREALIKLIQDHSFLEVVQYEDGRYQYDPLKVTIRTKDKRSGSWLIAEMADAGIWAEMADENGVLLILGLGELDSRIYGRLKQFDRCLEEKTVFFSPQAGAEQAVSELVDMKLDERATEVVPLENCEGRKAAEAIVPYPPGVPLLYRGESITSAHIEQMKKLICAEVRFQGQQPEQGIRVQMPGDET